MTIYLNGQPCYRAKLDVPWTGGWIAKLSLDGTAVPSGAATIQWGGATLVGTIDPKGSGAWNDGLRITVIGGAGWSSKPAAKWFQNDAELMASAVATATATSVGERISFLAGADRKLGVAYSRRNVTAATTLRRVLGKRASWWVDFAGQTYAGLRPSTAASTAVELLDYDAENQWAELGADDPSQIPVGGTLGPFTSRLTTAVRVTELHVEADDKGQRYRAGIGPTTAAQPLALSRLRSALAGLTRAEGVPEIGHLAPVRGRVLSQGVDGRISVQLLRRDGELADTLPVQLFPGTPGTSADVTEGQEVVLIFASADPADPIAMLASPKGQPGHVPIRTRHEATTEILMVTASLGIVRVGPAGIERMPVAKAPPVTNYLTALEQYLLFLEANIFPALVAVLPPAQQAQYAALVTARVTASGQFGAIPAQRLEAY